LKWSSRKRDIAVNGIAKNPWAVRECCHRRSHGQGWLLRAAQMDLSL
jgi:hypothetical protein